MNRILKRPMFRMGGTPNEGIMTGLTNPRKDYKNGNQVKQGGIENLIRQNYAEGDSVVPAPGNTQEYRDYIAKQAYPSSLLGDTNRLLGNVNDLLFNYGARPLGNLANYVVGANEGLDTIKARDYEKDTVDRILKAKGIDITEKEDEPINRIPAPTTKKKVPKEPEKELMDIYKENKGIIDEVMGNSDESTKRQLYLQLAKFGAGLASQPGGSLTAAIGKAAEKPLEGVGQVLADKKKTETDIKKLALQKSFEDMKEPEQVKFVKAIQKEYGLDSFADAYDLVTKSKKSSAELNAENTYYRTTGESMGVSPEGFRREMNRLDDLKLGSLIGEFTRPDAKLPEDSEDRTNGEYYVRPNGKAVRFVNGKLYEPGEIQFTAEVKATKKT
jgi:hypothetical protein